MKTPLGTALEDLVRDVGSAGGPPVEQLWAQGARRRARLRLGSAAAVAALVGLLAFVAWPALSAPAVPASPRPVQTQAPDTYPSVLAHPYFAPDVAKAHRPMTAVVLDASTAFAIDSRGEAWKVPGAGPTRAYAALSPNGRWMVDGLSVYDFVTGSSRTAPQPGAPDDHQLWAAWSPDSGHYVRAYDPSATIVVATPDGSQVPVPAYTPLEQVTRGFALAGGWLDDRTLMVTYSSQTEPSLDVYTWTIGDSSWRAVGRLTYPAEVNLEPRAMAVSPDGRTLAIGASLMNADYDSSVVTWDLTGVGGTGFAASGTVLPLHSRYAVDGVTWRDGDLFVTSSGRTGRVGGPAVVESTAGFAGLTSWRADAFTGTPYVNEAAVWRARLVVWITIPSALFGVWLLWRLALWTARRLGIIDGPMPLRFDPMWWRR
jgi:hypothetical protein